MALNRCINTGIRCQRKDVSLGSPDAAAKRPPTAFKKSNAGGTISLKCQRLKNAGQRTR